MFLNDVRRIRPVPIRQRIIVPLFAPAEAGEKATTIVQSAPMAIWPFAQVPVRTNSVPLLSWMLAIVRTFEPPLVNVVVCGVLAVPTV